MPITGVVFYNEGRWRGPGRELASRTDGHQSEGMGALPRADRVAGPIWARAAAPGGGLFAGRDL